jgi:hypothetical protein
MGQGAKGTGRTSSSVVASTRTRGNSGSPVSITGFGGAGAAPQGTHTHHTWGSGQGGEVSKSSSVGGFAPGRGRRMPAGGCGGWRCVVVCECMCECAARGTPGRPLSPPAVAGADSRQSVGVSSGPHAHSPRPIPPSMRILGAYSNWTNRQEVHRGSLTPIFAPLRSNRAWGSSHCTTASEVE